MRLLMITRGNLCVRFAGEQELSGKMNGCQSQGAIKSLFKCVPPTQF